METDRKASRHFPPSLKLQNGGCVAEPLKMSPQKIINPELYFPEHDKEADKMCHTVPYTAKATKPEML
jgi:hypothetical protein